ncbi:hypothetical protein Vafri_15885, partial [Volvox africanus]
EIDPELHSGPRPSAALTPGSQPWPTLSPSLALVNSSTWVAGPVAFESSEATAPGNSDGSLFSTSSGPAAAAAVAAAMFFAIVGTSSPFCSSVSAPASSAVAGVATLVSAIL